MSEQNNLKSMSRRQLLTGSAKLGAALIIGTGFVANPSVSWAVEVQHLKPETMATLIQMARDIYPHDHVGDEFYAAAVKGYDSEANKDAVEAGIAALNAAAAGKGHADYMAVGWERDRVDILRGMEESAFFQTVRGGLVTGLYNQKAVWPLFGYEGESFSKGGYLERGFDDINWV